MKTPFDLRFLETKVLDCFLLKAVYSVTSVSLQHDINSSIFSNRFIYVYPMNTMAQGENTLHSRTLYTYTHTLSHSHSRLRISVANPPDMLVGGK